MKKLFLLLILLLTVSIIHAQDDGAYTRGDVIYLKSGGYGIIWHPFMMLAHYDSADSLYNHDQLIVVLVDKYSYLSFPEHSRLLIKFIDESIVELESFGNVLKSYSNIYSNGVVDIYKTGRTYTIYEEDLQKILSLPIIKMRIELANGNRRDIEIKDKLGKKILKELQESYSEIQSTQEKRLENINDYDSDF